MEQREALERLMRGNGDDYAGLSRLIGRNPAYIQQFIKRGVPRKLEEVDRRRLAEYFGVSEVELGGPAEEHGGRLTAVPRLDVGASAGPGTWPGEEAAGAHLGFDPAWLRRLCPAGARDLSVIRVEGDSMEPTLSDGDDLMVDCADGAERLRDGIYVLRRGDALMVKRVATHPSRRIVTIRSDNPAYPDREVPLAKLTIVGRAVWIGRRLR